MKLEKKHWVIIGVVVAIIVIWYFFFKKKPAESSYNADYMCRMRGCKGVRPNGRCYGCRPLTQENVRQGTGAIFCPFGTVPFGGKCIPIPAENSYTPVVGTKGAHKCYCGKDDSTPPKDVWNITCCKQATA